MGIPIDATRPFIEYGDCLLERGQPRMTIISVFHSNLGSSGLTHLKDMRCRLTRTYVLSSKGGLDSFDVLVTSRQKMVSILQFCTNMKRFGRAQAYEKNLAHYVHHNMVSLTFSGHENSIPTLRALAILLLWALLKCTLKNKTT